MADMFLSPGLTSTPLAAGAGFLSAAAARILAFAGSGPLSADLSGVSVLLPNMKLAAPLERALFEAAGRPLLLPKSNTLSGMVEPWLTALDVMPDARRQLLLYGLLRGRDWLDEGVLWEVVSELTRLFDVLTEHAVRLPDDEADLQYQLEEAFALRDSQALHFEARLVNTLWRAEAQGKPSRAVARLLAAAEWLARLEGPLIVLLEGRDAGPLQALLDKAATRVPVLLLWPDRSLCEGALPAFLARTWPLAEGVPPLRERMTGCSRAELDGARASFRLLAAPGFEGLGEAVAEQVLDWLEEGRRHIALIACDRLASRRARALLERQDVLVQDETGWKMATTRAAAVVDAWLEVLASDAWHRALLDLLRAPLLLGDMPVLTRGQGLAALDRLVRRHGLLGGLDRFCTLAQREAPEALPLLERLVAARALMQPTQSASIPEWLHRLRSSLESLGALEHFEQDQAGRQWLGWLESCLAELAGAGEGREVRFRFAAWRTWFNRQMDAQLFRDERIDSPVIMTHLAATRLRAFDAAIVIGVDAEHLALPNPPGWLTHAGVRRALGLPGLATERQRLREDLAGLMLSSGNCVLAWQSQSNDEAMMPGADIAVLQAACAMVAGESCVDVPPLRACLASEDVLLPRRAAPVVPPSRIPQRLSASAFQHLVDCPYRFFARYVLRLNELEELMEGMEKKDFGEALHHVLLRFHSRFPALSGTPDETLISTLESLTEEVFREVTERNFHDHAWRLRWRRQIAAYIAWQRAREAEGWAWQAGELDVAREHELGADRNLLLFGRIDRVDQAVDGRQALLDYKSRAIQPLREQARDPDDVQLAFYTLLQGRHVGQAAYVALDGDVIDTAALPDAEASAAALQDCITESFNAMHAGKGLPAQGTASACAHCEMRGLCRKEWAA